MKQAMNVQKVMMKDMDLDEIADIKDNMEDMMWEQQQVNELLNRNYAMDDVNENDIDEELRDLDREMFQQALADTDNKNKNNALPNYYQDLNQNNNNNNFNFN